MSALKWYRRLTARSVKSNTKDRAILKNQKLMVGSDWFIVYGTKSGNSKLVALQLQKKLANAGVKVKCKNMASVRMSQLASIKRLFAVISTDGEGDPPESAMSFFKALKKQTENKFQGMEFTVCALGDSSYENYCQAGKDLEKLLLQKGASIFVNRVDCDAEFAPSATQWLKRVWAALQLESDEKENKQEFKVTVNESISARIGDIKKLTIGDSKKPCYHVQLNLDEDVSFIKPGDSIQLVPQNPAALVHQIAAKISADHKDDLNQFLGQEAELTTLTTNTLKRYYSITANETLSYLLKSEPDLKQFIEKANFLDLLCEYPAKLNLEQLKQILPKTRGRLYSVASSTQANANQIHLTVKSIRYKYLDRLHEGAGSIYVTETLKKNALVSIKHYKNPDFRLPDETDAPIIMIGTGTGIAPFRAFMHQYAHQKVKRKLWLIWGDKNKASDFVYANEIHQFENDQVLAKTDLAFSRDNQTKVYVQDLLQREQESLLQWLKNGAYIYVCGSAKMGKDVKQTVKTIINSAKSTYPDVTFDTLQSQNRYREDIY